MEENTQETKRVILCHVRLRPGDMPITYAVDEGIKIKEGEWVVVPTDHGIEVGQVVDKPIHVDMPLKCIPPKVQRLATISEIEDYYKNIEFEKEAWKICQKHIDNLGLVMKLIRVECFFDKSKIIFFYSADGRVDFRELVKELVRALRMRVEMRQIGIRHEAKLVGGIGACGREICCARFLTSFDSISIKMAKAQNLPLNPNKISGLCGRLLCCLTYEYETYKEMSQNLPSLGKACQTPSGQGKVIRQNIFKQAVTVSMPDGSIVEYTLDELTHGHKKETIPDGTFSLTELSKEPEEASEEQVTDEPREKDQGKEKEVKDTAAQKGVDSKEKKQKDKKHKKGKKSASARRGKSKRSRNSKKKNQGKRPSGSNSKRPGAGKNSSKKDKGQ